MLRTSEAPVSISSLRSCCRCGREFQSSTRELVCTACRKPKVSRQLSFREKQIVDLVRQAKANKEIAFELHLSEGTVKEYLNRIFRKLEVKSRTELAIWALTAVQ
jgi:DNA-binding NarL/FixJ family response regulator